MCGNVATRHAACTTPSPVNMIDAGGLCHALGGDSAVSFDVNPYNDGLYLSYFHGPFCVAWDVVQSDT